MLTSKRNPRGPRTLSLFFSAWLTMLRVNATRALLTLVPSTRGQRGTAKPRPANQPNIHSYPNHPKISLDTTSYKLYYVNYKMSRNFASVDCLWQSHKPSN